ncbi:MAG: glycosyltransferase involved in cell wall biosynthesis [Flavobacteriales bacterium]|jgi:glycosyltransferase involved in cell wall biosynthesis
MTKISVEFILPFFNPHLGWDTVVIDNIRQLETSLPNYEVLLTLVNDGSTESIPNEVLEGLHEQIPSLQYITYKSNKGKGHAIRMGVKKSRGDKLIYTDFDFPYTQQSVLDVIHRLDTSDVIIGVRSEAYYDALPDKRKRLSLRLQKLNKLLTGLPITDTQAGLKGFNRKGKPLFLRTKIHRFLFDLEFVDLAFNEARVKVSTQDIELKPNIEFTKFNKSVLLKEMKNLALLLVKMNVRRLGRFFKKS